MAILLVRHGETDGNAARILQRPDVPLNARGMRQAGALARRLSAHGFVHILCSDLLQERNFGDLRGKPYGELPDDPFAADFVPPNGEDWPTFHARVVQAFNLIVTRRRAVNGTLVVITHGLVCRALVERHAHVREGISVPQRFDNTGVTALHQDAPHAASLINCTAHLTAEHETGRSGAPA